MKEFFDKNTVLSREVGEGEGVGQKLWDMGREEKKGRIEELVGWRRGRKGKSVLEG